MSPSSQKHGLGIRDTDPGLAFDLNLEPISLLNILAGLFKVQMSTCCFQDGLGVKKVLAPSKHIEMADYVFCPYNKKTSALRYIINWNLCYKFCVKICSFVKSTVAHTTVTLPQKSWPKNPLSNNYNTYFCIHFMYSIDTIQCTKLLNALSINSKYERSMKSLLRRYDALEYKYTRRMLCSQSLKRKEALGRNLIHYFTSLQISGFITCQGKQLDREWNKISSNTSLAWFPESNGGTIFIFLCRNRNK